MSIPSSSPEDVPGGPTGFPDYDSARTLQPISTRGSTNGDSHLPSSSIIMPLLSSRSPANSSQASAAQSRDGSSDRPSSVGLMPPPPPPPSRQPASRNSIPESPGGSEYPAATASHPVPYPGLRDALHDLHQDSGAAGLPLAEHSRSSTRPPSTRHSSDSYSERLAEVYGSLHGTNPFDDDAESGRTGEAYRGRDPVGDNRRLIWDVRHRTQMDGAASVNPLLSQHVDMSMRTASTDVERMESPGWHGVSWTRETPESVAPTASEWAIMRSAAEAAQLARPETIRPGLQQTVAPNNAPISADGLVIARIAGQALSGTTGQVSYPAVPAGHSQCTSLPQDLPAERLDSTADAATPETAQTLRKKASGSPIDRKRSVNVDELCSDPRNGSGA